MITDLEMLVTAAVLVAAIVYACIVRAALRRSAAISRELTHGNINGAFAVMDGQWDGVERRKHPRLTHSFPVRTGKMP